MSTMKKVIVAIEVIGILGMFWGIYVELRYLADIGFWAITVGAVVAASAALAWKFQEGKDT